MTNLDQRISRQMHSIETLVEKIESLIGPLHSDLDLRKYALEQSILFTQNRDVSARQVIECAGWFREFLLNLPFTPKTEAPSE